MIERDELSAWLRLLETPGIGSEAARRLLAAFASPEGVFGASESAWRRVVSTAQAAALVAPPASLAALTDTTLRWLEAGKDRHVLPLGHPAYPALLLATADPPLLLHAQGRIELLQTDAIAVVGSRNPTRQGADNARAFAAALSQAGFAVVSGLALGIDGAAHEGALGHSGSTVAVVGTGLDRVYPARHQELAHRVARHGVLLSEYPLGTPALAANFPRRNRIISGLAHGTLVVEAALRSGSLITARLAAEQGREVFAIPGSIHSPQSRGCHLLIKQGAKLVESAADILDELKTAHAPAAADDPAPSDDPVLQALGWEPTSLDALVARTGWPAAELSARLLEFELNGCVARLGGQLFQRVGHA